MSHSLGIAIESLVAILLMLTIGYCMLLNKRLKRLKADEHSLKAVIAELITATEIAERAIGGRTVAAVEEATRGRRRGVSAAVQDRDRRAARVRAGGCGPQNLHRQGGRRGGAGVLRAQKV